MSSDLTAAAKQLTRELRDRAAVLPSSVNVKVAGGKLVARCRVQLGVEHEIAQIVRQCGERYGISVDFKRID